MKILFLNKCLLLVGIMALVACRNQPANAPASTETMPAAPATGDVIVVNQQGEITLNGSKLASFEDLAAGLSTSLAKQEPLPDSIVPKFEGEVGMGPRQEVETIITEALQAARGARYKPVTDALRPAVERELKNPVGLQVEMYHAEGGVAFLWAKLTNPDGSPFDFSKTPFAREYEGGVFSDDVFGLLKNEGGAWKVLASSVGATDVPYMCWWKEYGVAKTAFPEGMAADDCE
ncbi:MAG: hypothetical protein HY842_11040 [Bacteroidetes bacterium]|nr:hypothetical protein [Bacteroidota bacterium]